MGTILFYIYSINVEVNVKFYNTFSRVKALTASLVVVFWICVIVLKYTSLVDPWVMNYKNILFIMGVFLIILVIVFVIVIDWALFVNKIINLTLILYGTFSCKIKLGIILYFFNDFLLIFTTLNLLSILKLKCITFKSGEIKCFSNYGFDILRFNLLGLFGLDLLSIPYLHMTIFYSNLILLSFCF